METKKLKVEQVGANCSFKPFQSILESDIVKDQKQLSILIEQLKAELQEIGTNRKIYLASQEKEPISYAQLILRNADNDPKLANGIDIAHLHNLRVKKDKRGQGIGKATTIFLEQEAKKSGFKTLTLGVDNWNLAAFNLYKGLGYKVFREEEGRSKDEILYLMKKEL